MKKYFLFNPTPFETHRIVLDKIKEGSEVLDLGCATGYFAKILKEKKCRVWGVDHDKNALKHAKKFCISTAYVDLETVKSLPFKKKFDYILLLDVLEHLKNPNKLLILIKKYLKPDGKLILSTPNIAFISVRLSLLLGKFNYRSEGIMDENHVHFYTKKSLTDFLKECGYKIQEIDISSGFSQVSKIGKYLNLIPKAIQYKITKVWDEGLAYQLIFVAS